MNFEFDVNRIFEKKINKVTHTLVPAEFSGNKEKQSDVQMKVSKILDDMGEASAIAQSLNKPVTSASRLRDTDHTVYLLVDSSGNRGLGSIVGLLKTGWKNLFLFDEAGLYFQQRSKCVLDFFIHESMQRVGLGKILYEHMLEEENTKPEKLAIDRPSKKFLKFLQKHYGVHEIITQNNKFVVFKGFFDDVNHTPINKVQPMQSGELVSADQSHNHRTNVQLLTREYPTFNSPAPKCFYGRYAATKPECSIGNIIHNVPTLEQIHKHTG